LINGAPATDRIVLFWHTTELKKQVKSMGVGKFLVRAARPGI
jgi:hypothetical protein